MSLGFGRILINGKRQTPPILAIIDVGLDIASESPM